MRPFLRIDENTALHLPSQALVQPIFEAIDENRAYLRKWLPWVDGTRSIEDTKTFITESMVHNQNGNRLTTFILYGDRLAGTIGVVNFNREHHKCELGYWLREDMQGRGIMANAATIFMDYLFKSKGMNRIEAQVLVGNHRSRALLQRLGFSCEGCMRQAVFMYRGYYDCEIYGLVKEDWPVGKVFWKKIKKFKQNIFL